MTAILISFFTSTMALRKAVRQTDNKLIYYEVVGGWYNTVTSILNPLAGLLFLAGLVAIVFFVGGNIK